MSKKQTNQADVYDLARAAAAGPSRATQNTSRDDLNLAEDVRHRAELQARLDAMAAEGGGTSSPEEEDELTNHEPAAKPVHVAPPKAPPPQAAKPTAAQAQPQIALPTKRGRIFKPRRTIIYSDPGLGKSTAAADIDGVLFFDLNNGTEMLDVPRYVFRPDDEMRGHVPLTLQEFGIGIRAVRASPTGVRVVAIDMYTDLELLAMKHILIRDAAAEGKEKLHSLESYGYGKGKQHLFDQMRDVLSLLDSLITVGVGVVIIAHAMNEKKNNLTGADYDHATIRALNTKEVSLSAYLFGWADEVGYLHFDDKAAKLGKGGREKGITGTKRILEFDHSAAFDAKARLPLAPRVQIGSANPWQFMREALAKAYTMKPSEIRQEIQDELSRIGDPELAVKVDLAVAAVGDNLDKLTAYMQELRRREPVSADDEQIKSENEEI